MVLSYHVQSFKVLVLIELLEDDLLLNELFLKIPEFSPIVPIYVEDFRVVLHRNKPSQRRGRRVSISFTETDYVAFCRFLNNYRPH